ncbi:hypothetical protein HY249_03430 [Candidatus Azambacteria bacterium]|nr:hypothetical protein [Candidatus Azambacteria bacterium]
MKKERMERILDSWSKAILGAIFILLLLALSGMISGCATMEDTRLKTLTIDPSFNGVLIENNSQYLLQEKGLFNMTLEPGEQVRAVVYPGPAGAGCYGRYDGVMEAYRIVGRASGERVIQKYSEIEYSLYIDGKNVLYKGKSVDDYRVFADGYFYPRPQATLIPPIRVAIRSCRIIIVK